MNRSPLFTGLCILLALLLLPAAIRADVIVLKNGRTVEGIVDSETPESLTLRLGAGTMTIRRDRIAEIRLASPRERDEIRQAWRRQYLLHDRYVPAGCEPLAQRFKALQRRRDGAIRARRELSQADSSIRSANRKASELRRQLAETGRMLQAASPRDDAAAYNALVLEGNRQQAALTVLEMEVAEAAAGQPAGMGTIAAYLAELQACRDDVAHAGAALPPAGAETRDFLDALLGRLEKLDAEFAHIAVPARRQGNTTLVSVLVNGNAAGTFIVDTGAGVVAISQSFARKAGIAPDQGSPTTVTMADGRETQAMAILLKSVKVGDAVARDIPAVVMPAAPGEGIDGLLGMSFLGHFMVGMDGHGGRLVLQDFRPRQE